MLQKNPTRRVTKNTIDRIAAWCGGDLITNENYEPVGIEIPQKSGTILANLGDYVTQNSNGYFIHSVKT